MSNVLLRKVIEKLLAERRVPATSSKHLVKRINSELVKFAKKPDMWATIQRRMKSHVGNPDPDVIDDLVNTVLEELGDSAFDSEKSPYIGVKVLITFLAVDREGEKRVAKQIISLIDKISKNYGWSVLTSSHKFDWNPTLRFTLEKNYGTRVDDIPNVLYHTTPVENVEKILKKGLVPKQASHKSDQHKFEDEEAEIEQGRQYKPRVYLTPSKQLASELSYSFQGDAYADAMMGHGSYFDSYILLKIDTAQLLPGTKLFVDDEFRTNERFAGQSFWTYSRIPARAITIDSQDRKAWDEFLEDQASDEEITPW